MLTLGDMHLRSANRQLLAMPIPAQHRPMAYGRWAFSVVGNTVWNSLPDFTRGPDDQCTLAILARDVIISCLCYDVSVRLSVLLSVTEVYWRIIGPVSK